MNAVLDIVGLCHEYSACDVIKMCCDVINCGCDTLYSVSNVKHIVRATSYTQMV